MQKAKYGRTRMDLGRRATPCRGRLGLHLHVGRRGMRYRVGPYAIDTAAYELRCGSARLPVEPQVFDLIALLIAARTRVVDKDEIVRAVWHGRPISDAAVSSRIKSARRALGDSGAKQGMIKTVYRRGFRFVGSVTELPDKQSSVTDAQPRLALRRFRADGKATARRIAAGLAEEVMHALAASGQVVLVTRPGPPPDGLGPTHLIEGRVRQDGAALRLSARLLDAHYGTALWCGRLDGTIGRAFITEENMASALAEAVLGALRADG